MRICVVGRCAVGRRAVGASLRGVCLYGVVCMVVCMVVWCGMKKYFCLHNKYEIYVLLIVIICNFNTAGGRS